MKGKKQTSKRPWFVKPKGNVSKRMRQVRSSGTSLEAAMERIFKKQGIKYEKQPDLIGKPDFRIKGLDILVFCDSSFWHGRRENEVSGRAFKRNRAFWTQKLKYNRQRDQRINRQLRKEGWSVWRFWDTDITKRPEYVKNRLMRAISGKINK
jgi:DNA mismatch endonuclease (patch repair protein)